MAAIRSAARYALTFTYARHAHRRTVLDRFHVKVVCYRLDKRRTSAPQSRAAARVEQPAPAATDTHRSRATERLQP